MAQGDLTVTEYGVDGNYRMELSQEQADGTIQLVASATGATKAEAAEAIKSQIPLYSGEVVTTGKEDKVLSDLDQYITDNS